jgi:HPt (histidine-containing phosphotransfer) domain-containing protein
MLANLDFLKSFTKGDVEKMNKYISIFIDTVQQKDIEIKKALEDKKKEVIKIHVHTLKSQCRYMGLNNLEPLILQIEEACGLEDSSLDAIAEQLSTLLTNLNQAILELAEVIQKK